VGRAFTNGAKHPSMWATFLKSYLPLPLHCMYVKFKNKLYYLYLSRKHFYVLSTCCNLHLMHPSLHFYQFDIESKTCFMSDFLCTGWCLVQLSCTCLLITPSLSLDPCLSMKMPWRRSPWVLALMRMTMMLRNLQVISLQSPFHPGITLHL